MNARRLILATACAVLGTLALAGAPAWADLTHNYLSQLTGFGDPAAVTVGPTGDLYVADSTSHVVDRFTSAGAPAGFSAAKPYVEGSRLTGTPSGPFGQPQGVAVNNSTGDIYVSDAAQQVVDVFSSSGEYLSHITGTPPSAAVSGPFRLPDGLAVDQSTGKLYVADAHSGVVDVFNASGEYASQLGAGVLSRSYAGSVAVNDLTGNVYVGDSGPVAVLVFDSLGSFVPPEWPGAGTPNGSFGTAYLYVGLNQSSGHVYVADTGHAVVNELGSSSSEEYLGRVTGTSSGAFTSPQAVAVDPSSGVLYVADESHVVDVFGPAVTVPGASIQAPTGVNQTSAVAGGSVNPAGVQVSSCDFEYGTSSAYGQSAPCDQTPTQIGAGNTPVAVTATLNALQPHTTYHYRLSAANANGANTSLDVSFTTPAPPGLQAVSAEVNPTEKAGQTNATLQAQINPHGAETSYHFEYGPTKAYGISIPAPAGTLPAANEFVALPGVELTGLQIGTTYHYRLVASNQYGTIAGPDQEFTTLPTTLIESASTSSVTATSATLNAQINPFGRDTSVYFQYGTANCASSPASCTDLPLAPGTDIGSGESVVPLSAHLQNLTPGSTYHFRVLATTTTTPGTVETSDRTFTTQSAGTAVALPDAREWELVSPPNKQGSGIISMGSEQGADIQASVGGGAITYGATSPFVANPAGSNSPEVTQVFSTRRAPGSWDTLDITTPHNEGATELAVGHLAEYKIFSNDLSLGLVEPNGHTPLPPLPAGSEKTIYLRAANGDYTALVTAANVLSGATFGGNGEGSGGVAVITGTPDMSHVVLTSSVRLTSTPTPPGARSLLYEWANGQLQLVSVLPNKETTEAQLGNSEVNVRHAISDDGSRVVWEGNDEGTLYLRDMTKGETVQLGDGRFQTASSDESRVFFTTGGTQYQTGGGLSVFELTSGSGGALAGKSTKLTPGGVEGVIGASEDGSYVYFVDSEVLGDAGEHGATPGRNLYADHYDQAAKTWAAPLFIATLSGEDAPTWGHGETGLNLMTSRVSPDGRYLAFMSDQSLTGYDNRDASGGVRDEEVFWYDAGAHRLVCASCNPTGARPVGLLRGHAFEENLVDYAEIWQNRWLAGNIPGWTTTAHGKALTQSRYLEDGGRLFFNSSDALVPGDVNGKEDVYEFEPAGVGSCRAPGYGQSAGVVFSPGMGGCVALISAGTSSEESAFMGASETGGDVFFLTLSRLSAQDYDTSIDLYDAHECTTEAPCARAGAPVPSPCTTGDACKAGPTPQPAIFGAPSSETFSGAGNVVPSTPARPKAAKSLTRAQKLARALRTCRRKSRGMRAACQRQARKRYAINQSARKRSATNTGR